MTLERPMFPPRSRRGFFSFAGSSAAVAAAAIVPTMALAAPAGLPDAAKAGPALKAAVIALDDAKIALDAASAANAAAVAKAERWEAEHPKPTSKRGIKRWWRKYHDHTHAVTEASWYGLLEAEKSFKAAQAAVARIQPADYNELALMGSAAAIYDRVDLSYGQKAIISYGFALGYFKLLYREEAGA